jgi:chromosome segregation ATPase
VKTWSDYVAEAEQYKHYKQRCEALEADLQTARQAMHETVPGLLDRIEHVEQRCEQLEGHLKLAIERHNDQVQRAKDAEQRCEQLEADLADYREALRAANDASARQQGRCEQLEAVYQAAETLVNQWASPDPDREAAEFAAIALQLQRAVRQHRAERRALRLSGDDQR